MKETQSPLTKFKGVSIEREKNRYCLVLRVQALNPEKD